MKNPSPVRWKTDSGTIGDSPDQSPSAVGSSAPPDSGRRTSLGGMAPVDPSRRSFLGKAGGLATAAMAASVITLEPLLGGKHSLATANEIGPLDDQARADASFAFRV